jgi:hypothetical protein
MEQEMAAVISFDDYRQRHGHITYMRSQCPVCDQIVSGHSAPKGGSSFICISESHDKFRWSEPSHNELGMLHR